MKPGCFLKSIIVLTIIVAAIAYIIQHKSGLFFNHGKKLLTEAFMDEWDNDFDYVRDTPEKIKLEDSLRSFLDSLKLQEIPDDKKIDRITRMVRAAVTDSIISDSELKEITNNLKSIKNERSEQNRN